MAPGEYGLGVEFEAPVIAQGLIGIPACIQVQTTLLRQPAAKIFDVLLILSFS